MVLLGIAAFTALVALVVLIAGPKLMQIAFGDKFSLRPRRACCWSPLGMGLYLALGDRQPGLHRPGPGAPRRGLLDRLRGRLHRLEPAAARLRRVPPGRDRLPARRRRPLRAPLPASTAAPTSAPRTCPSRARRRSSRRGWRRSTRKSDPSGRTRVRRWAHHDAELILIAGALLAAGIVGALLADRVRIPGLLLFLGLGMLAGSEGIGGIEFDDAELARTLGTIALVLILFEGGLTAGWSEIRPVLGTAASLATIGTVADRADRRLRGEADLRPQHRWKG